MKFPAYIGLGLLSLVLRGQAQDSPPSSPPPSPVPATPEQQFEAASAAYRSGDVENAVSTWNALLREGYRAPALDYNLGNAYTRLGNQPQAILHFQRARLAAPNDPDTEANLAKVVRDSGAATAPRPAWHWTLMGFPASLISTLFFAAFWAGFISLALGLWLPARKDGLRAISGLCFGTALLCAGILFGQRHALAQEQIVVMKNGVSAQFQPIENGTEHFTLQAGSTAWLREIRGNWWLIQSGEQSGWMPSEACARINR